MSHGRARRPSGYARMLDSTTIRRRTKMARYVPRRSGTSKTAVSSVIEFSHTSGAFRAALIRSAELSKRSGSPLAKNASPSRMASRLSALGSLGG